MQNSKLKCRWMANPHPNDTYTPNTEIVSHRMNIVGIDLTLNDIKSSKTLPPKIMQMNVSEIEKLK